MRAPLALYLPWHVHCADCGCSYDFLLISRSALTSGGMKALKEGVKRAAAATHAAEASVARLNGLLRDVLLPRRDELSAEAGGGEEVHADRCVSWGMQCVYCQELMSSMPQPAKYDSRSGRSV